ncbi:putative peptidase M1, membrane alanine aminopeptidase, aminopeptidase N-like protein [Helianthus annuus]|uniref:Transcription initiation factor TFIID subunit 2 n=1 Tax=Helianthus annuus TaxID=4232 RepID=A0A251UUK0_HELAN|nr:transcription initiation factor TFIID subunit 2 isoform X2 [Helianthus annuus]KAF5806616.1 putative peptidase M1, membrane alanine aminopeptidase [Helianthus annuus]KAJ0585211.1 putative peptidase M1, membrane alanine aminopeptidase, peptidase M4/M1, CTD superfamily [Helianthus annuus]KAJ0919696.1 putative peptidase M1, membrane alanine aminopeptidase, aminopeptidase N-like protein [Helianthus annuus]KAJ0923434.1 putative peptidase M1, membrane alanine aminopeptidase [Helianthus annuus]
MAKPRKHKTEDQKADNSEAVVKHQKLCLAIDLEKRRIYGYTELEVAVPENGIVGLHADNLMIECVTVDGEPARFEIFPHYQQMDSDDRWCSVSSTNSAADAAGSVYVSCLERELVPNLLIMCSNEATTKPVPEQLEETVQENGTQTSSESKQNVKLIRIDYWVEKIETGIHIEKDVMHTNNQIRRARCWFPCMDDSLQRCCFDLEFTVANNLVAASTGTLMYQVLTNDDPPRKTYIYKINVPVAAQWISLAVAPFEIFPDRHNNLITHICLSHNLPKLRNTVGFLYSAYSHYEHYLSTKFPFGSYTQVFIDPEMAISSLSLGASMNIFSSQILFDEKIIDQTIDTRIKLAYGLARQWFGVYITAEAPNDEWLLDGLAWFLTDSFIKQFLGNNEARYRRYKANCAVCKADDSAATALSSSDASKALYGTQCIGFYGKIRSWKSVAVLQMLEKQMGPESFCKVLKNLVAPPKDTTHPLRTLSTKEFRHLANEVGNLERPFLREFFPRWVGSSGCPVLKMGFSYNKRKNLVELAALRGCTATPDSNPTYPNSKPDFVKREADAGWPGMMSIRVHELDGMYDHPVLPMAGETWQLLEIQCHSRLASKRFQKPKKGPKHDGSDDNADTVASVDMRSNNDSPLQWLRADPEMEYLAEIHFNQPVQMWINQLEKDKDVVAQVQAITALELFPRLLSIVNALSNLLCDSQAFWRVRIEAAFALASTASEETDWAGLLHLIKFYKSRRYDEKIGLPKPNDFHDFAEYFVLEAIPHAVALVRAPDKKSPREAVEFILQLLKYNENNGNPYSDVFWLAALVQSVGELEFGQQTVAFLSSLVKRIDRLLQFDRLMPSYNGILTVSCIRTLTQIALKLSEFTPLDRIFDLIKPFSSSKTQWQVRIEAFRALLDLEYHCKGIDAALILFIKYLEEEPSLRGQVKLGVHAMRLCQISGDADDDHGVMQGTLVALLRLLESPVAFNNVTLRHYLFCILQVLAGRPPTLCGVPRDETVIKGHTEICNELKNFFAAIVNQSKPAEPSLDALMLPCDEPANETNTETNIVSITDNERTQPQDITLTLTEPDVVPKEGNDNNEQKPPDLIILDSSEAHKEPDTVSNSQERKKPVLKIRMKQSSAASSRAEDVVDNAVLERSQGAHNGGDHGTSSSMSMDAPPQRNFIEPANVGNQNVDDVNSCHDLGSRVTASIGSAKLPHDGHDDGVGDGDATLLKELQCTAESSKVQSNDVETVNHNKYISLRALNEGVDGLLAGPSNQAVSGNKEKEKDKKKKDKEKKRKKKDKDDPEYLERKRLKKEKKRKEKELAKLMATPPLIDAKQTESVKDEVAVARVTNVTTPVDGVVKRPEGTTSTHKLKIKIKNRTLTKP